MTGKNLIPIDLLSSLVFASGAAPAVVILGGLSCGRLLGRDGCPAGTANREDGTITLTGPELSGLHVDASELEPGNMAFPVTAISEDGEVLNAHVGVAIPVPEADVEPEPQPSPEMDPAPAFAPEQDRASEPEAPEGDTREDGPEPADEPEAELETVELAAVVLEEEKAKVKPDPNAASPGPRVHARVTAAPAAESAAPAEDTPNEDPAQDTAPVPQRERAHERGRDQERGREPEAEPGPVFVFGNGVEADGFHGLMEKSLPEAARVSWGDDAGARIILTNQRRPTFEGIPLRHWAAPKDGF